MSNVTIKSLHQKNEKTTITLGNVPVEIVFDENGNSDVSLAVASALVDVGGFIVEDRDAVIAIGKWKAGSSEDATYDSGPGVIVKIVQFCNEEATAPDGEKVKFDENGVARCGLETAKRLQEVIPTTVIIADADAPNSDDLGAEENEESANDYQEPNADDEDIEVDGGRVDDLNADNDSGSKADNGKNTVEVADDSADNDSTDNGDANKSEEVVESDPLAPPEAPVTSEPVTPQAPVTPVVPVTPVAPKVPAPANKKKAAPKTTPAK